MPVTPTYPGVYVEELPSGVRTITGVATSVAAFVDGFKRGPIDKAVQVLSFADFEREFGGLDTDSEASYAIQQFFNNGGSEAWVVRVARQSDDDPPDPNAARPATAEIGAAADGAATLTVAAANPGRWGNELRVGVEPLNGNGSFNLVVSQFAADDDRPVLRRQDIHRNLVMTAGSPRFVGAVVNDPESGSELVRIAADAGTSTPLASGTLSGALDASGVSLPRASVIEVTVDGAGANGAASATATARVTFPGGAEATRPLLDIAAALEGAIRAAKPEHPGFAGATVRTAGTSLWVLPGRGVPAARIRFGVVTGDPTASALRLTTQAAQQTATLSGPHAAPPELPAAPKVNVTIGGNTMPVDLTLPAGITLPGPVPLVEVAKALRAGIRAAEGSNRSTVIVSGDQLLVLPGPDLGTATFANASPTDTTADALLLTAAATTLPATTSAAHNAAPELPAAPKIRASVGAANPLLSLTFPDAVTLPGPVPIATVATVLEAALRAANPGDAFAKARVIAETAGGKLVILPGEPGLPVSFADAAADDEAAATLKLTDEASVNVAEYQLGGAAITGTAQLGGEEGVDGASPDAQALIGSPAAKTGIFALEDVDLFNLLCIPRAALLPETEAQAVLSTAIQYCERRRAFFLMDTPADIEKPAAIKSWLAQNDTLRHRNAALYFPRVKIPDPLDGFRLRSIGASGTVAGIYARTDSTRGVWKAPAGTETALRNVTALDALLTDGENGTLNPIAVNCLRTFPVFGTVAWGARTLDGADQKGSEWKYVPVRRLALFLEESLYRGTKWVVFEPNDEPLWAQIRLNLGAFMQNLFRQGAFQGATPREAYFVKCDKETTTQNDINLGIVNIVVGFAPLKPAEFVIIKFQQMAGQIAT